MKNEPLNGETPPLRTDDRLQSTRISSQSLLTQTGLYTAFTWLFALSGFGIAVALQWDKQLSSAMYVFNILGGICLLLLLLFCLFSLRGDGIAVRLFQEYLPQEKFADIHAGLLDVQPAFRREAISIATTAIVDLRTALQNHRRQFAIHPLMHWIEDIEERLNRCEKNPDSAEHILTRKNSTADFDRPFDPFGHFFANALLFIGIIGTFYGLIQVFDSPTLRDLLERFRSGETFDEKLSFLVNGFNTSFGTSLVAYIGYLCARVMLHLTEQNFSSLHGFVEQRIWGGLVNAFSPLMIYHRVELSENSQAIIQRGVEDGAATRHDVAQSLSRMDEIAAKMGGVATSFGRSVRQLNRSTARVLRAMSEAQKIWTDASNSWTTTTEKFSATGEGLAASMSSAIDAVSSSCEKIGAAHIRFDESARRITSAWNDAIAKMAAELANNINDYDSTLKRFSQRLSDQIESFEETRALLKAISEQVDAGRAQLEDAITTVVLEESESRALIANALRATQEQTLREVSSIRDLIAAAGERASRSVTALEELRSALIGSGAPEDLLSVLREIERHLGSDPVPSRSRTRI